MYNNKELFILMNMYCLFYNIKFLKIYKRGVRKAYLVSRESYLVYSVERGEDRKTVYSIGYIVRKKQRKRWMQDTKTSYRFQVTGFGLRNKMPRKIQDEIASLVEASLQ